MPDAQARAIVAELRQIQHAVDEQGARHNFEPKNVWGQAAGEIDRLTKDLEEAQQILEESEQRLHALAFAPALKGVRELVAGWQGPPDKPYAPHPPNLGAHIATTCGRIYQLDIMIEAGKAHLHVIRAALSKATGERGGVDD